MERRRTWWMIGCLIALPLLLGQSCGTPTSEDESESLTQAQSDAVEAGVQAAASLAQAVGTSQNGAGNATDAGRMAAELSAGSCPQVTTATTEGQQGLAVALDFGEGCAPYGTTGYTCSGSADGELDLTGRTLSLTFEAIGCNTYSLDGSVALAWDRSVDEVELDGDWDLSWTADDATYGTDGAGVCRYDLDALATTVDTFTGSVTDATTTYSCDLTDVVISLVNNETLIPSSGTVTLTNDQVGALSIRFDEDSPSTGEVEVSINGGPYLPWDLTV